MIDAEAFVYQLGTRDIAAAALPDDISFAADIDVNQLAALPAFVFNLTGDGQSANGPGLWYFILTWSTFGDGMDQAKKYARVGYDIVHAWNDNPAATELEVDGDTVWVSSIEDIDLPSRLSSAQIDGRNVTQYVGSFALALRN